MIPVFFRNADSNSCCCIFFNAILHQQPNPM
jgi:hypothetical protein